MIAYVTTQGAKIVREGQRLIVIAPEMKHTLFSGKLEQLLLFGNVQLTAPARFLLLRENIDTVFLRADGRFMGRLASAEPANVFLRKKQFLLTDDEVFCLKVAKRIVQAKIMNQATLLARIKRSRQEAQAGKISKELRIKALSVDKVNNLETLRGVEGSAAALYFSHLPLAFIHDWGFTRRVRRPPTDPINAVLSLLYTILINRCYAAVRLAGLDPYPGVLHSLAYGRNALPLDLVEEFRAMLADALTVALFNMRMLDWDDFINPVPNEENNEDDDNKQDAMDAVIADSLGCMTENVFQPDCSDLAGEQLDNIISTSKPEKKPLLLTSKAFKNVITAFSKKMETTFVHPVSERQMTYNEALVFQARQYRRVLEGEIENYSPLMLR